MVIGMIGILLLLLLLGGLVVVAGLLAYPRTRPFGLALLGVFGVVGMLLFGYLSVRTTVWRHHNTMPATPLHDVSPIYTPAPQIFLEEVNGSARVEQSLADGTVELVQQSSTQEEQEERVSEEAEDENHGSDAEDEKSEDEVSEDSDNKSKVDENDSEKPSSDEPETAVKVSAKPKDEIPTWIDALPSTVGGVYRQVVNSGPWRDTEDCYRQVNQSLYGAVEEILREIAREELRQPNVVVPSLESLGISTNWIREHLVRLDPEPFMQMTDSSVGPMKTLYVQLEVDRNDREFLRERWRDHARRDRIAAVAAGGTFLLGGIGLLFGLLKIDTWTKGYYTKRLFLGVPAAIIGIGTLLALLIKGF